MPPIRVYSTTHCGYCVRAKMLLEKLGLAFEEIDVTGNDDARKWLVSVTGGRKTVPQIFIGDAAIGGWQELCALQRSGQLAEMLNMETA